MRAYLMTAVGLALAAPALAPARADVKAGVDAWARGDFKAAVDEWRPLAVAGDSDAQFNLGQAYKLGRGVPVDPALAQSWFRKAAAQGHPQAEDNLGLSLFQDGRKAEALPWLEKSVGRDEKRAELVLGTMLFNGDGAPKDWTRAYALVTRSSQQGLTQAGPTLAQLDQYVPAEQRQKGIALAQQYERMAKQAPPPSRATVDPTAPAATYGARTPAPPPAAVGGITTRTDAKGDLSITVPHPRSAPLTGKPSRVSPIPTTGRDVIADKDGRPLPPPKPAAKPGPSPRPAPEVVARPAPTAKPTPVAAAKPAPAPRPAATASGGRYRIQLGAFSNEANARTLWSRVGGRTGGSPAYVRAGKVVRLQATGFASRAEAQRACAKAGGGCLVVAPWVRWPGTLSEGF